MLKFIKRVTGRQIRTPATSGQVVALPSAILLVTKDGNNVVITPDLARDIHKVLPEIIEKAENGFKNGNSEKITSTNQ